MESRFRQRRGPNRSPRMAPRNPSLPENHNFFSSRRAYPPARLRTLSTRLHRLPWILPEFQLLQSRAEIQSRNQLSKTPATLHGSPLRRPVPEFSDSVPPSSLLQSHRRSRRPETYADACFRSSLRRFRELVEIFWPGSGDFYISVSTMGFYE